MCSFLSQRVEEEDMEGEKYEGVRPKTKVKKGRKEKQRNKQTKKRGDVASKIIYSSLLTFVPSN